MECFLNQEVWAATAPGPKAPKPCMEVPFLHLGFRDPNYSSWESWGRNTETWAAGGLSCGPKAGSRPDSGGGALRRRGPSPHRGAPANLQDRGQASWAVRWDEKEMQEESRQGRTDQTARVSFMKSERKRNRERAWEGSWTWRLSPQSTTCRNHKGGGSRPGWGEASLGQGQSRSSSVDSDTEVVMGC